MNEREHWRRAAALGGARAAAICRRAYALAFAAALALSAAGAAFDGTWEEAWDDSARPGETVASASAAIAETFDSRVAGAMAAAETAVDSRFCDVEETSAGRLDTRPPAGFFIIVR